MDWITVLPKLEEACMTKRGGITWRGTGPRNSARDGFSLLLDARRQCSRNLNLLPLKTFLIDLAGSSV